ncbi:MAG: sortase [Microbacteriaceae bacterium]
MPNKTPNWRKMSLRDVNAQMIRRQFSEWSAGAGVRWRKLLLSLGIDLTGKTVTVIGPPPLEHDSRPASQSMPTLERGARLEVGGLAITTAGILLIATLVQMLILSPVFFFKQQQILFTDFRYQLANATAPVGQVDQNDLMIVPGSPVAIIDIAAINVHQVVVEGTDSLSLMSGPGHRRDTPLPGQYGTSVIYGRQFTYGGPFGRIGELPLGSKINVTTGQGKSTYSVYDIRYSGDPLPESNTQGGRLTLVSAAGIPFAPNTVVRVDAKLMSDPKVTPAQMFSIESLSDAEAPLAGDTGGFALLALQLVFELVIVFLMALSFRYWGPRQTWVVATPLLLALGIAIGIQTATILPNLL